ncbi:hypothetical protein [Actinomadura fibrosa]|uniref:Uncharacterized protein n=1 Tax=Actinomadura fibrosa TaxID=111802 RepID=A0ABW2XHV0_9ACTN|nr:hypothetical protein [Actinomadura fibrosa]
MGEEDIEPAAGEVAAMEIIAQIMEALRSGGCYQTRYDNGDQRAVLQRSGRIARAAFAPRRITARSSGSVFTRLDLPHPAGAAGALAQEKSRR